MDLELLLRGADFVLETLQQKLKGKQKLRVKYGIDPTGPQIHLGRAVPIQKLKLFQQAGHQVVLIIGDFTARIGDASDKTAERRPLSASEIKANMTDYSEQLGLILDMGKVELHYNSEWFDRLPLADFIKQTQLFTVAQMIERENFSDRYAEQRPIGLHEFLYPVLQGYDSVKVRADLEVGGSDQLFNLMAGRVVQKASGQPPQEVLTYGLLEGTDGRKMSTSWNNAIYVTDTPDEMFGKIMSLSDELMRPYFELATELTKAELEGLLQRASGPGARAVKARLASEIVAAYHGAAAAKTAAQRFDKQFRDREIPADVKQVVIAGSPQPITDALVKVGLASSKTAARRLIKQGGVKINGRRVEDDSSLTFKRGDTIQIGSRQAVQVK